MVNRQRLVFLFRFLLSQSTGQPQDICGHAVGNELIWANTCLSRFFFYYYFFFKEGGKKKVISFLLSQLGNFRPSPPCTGAPRPEFTLSPTPKARANLLTFCSPFVFVLFCFVNFLEGRKRIYLTIQSQTLPGMKKQSQPRELPAASCYRGGFWGPPAWAGHVLPALVPP